MIGLRMILIRAIVFLFFILFNCAFCIEQVSPPWGYVFNDWKGSPIDVIVYIPNGADENTRFLIVVPGASRDTQRFHASWLSSAKEDTFVVVTIGARREYYKDEYSYNAGNVIDSVNTKIKKEKWLFSAIEKIFNSVKNKYGFKTKKFYLFGHSAGGGFVHRYMLFMPDAPVEKAVAANPAFVTLPDYEIDYPFGIKNVLVSDSMIKKWFNSGLAIFLGAYDTGPRTKPLSNGPMAKAQGPNCLSRGRLLYNEAKEEAKKRKSNFNWDLIIVPRVGHDNRLIAPYAKTYLFNNLNSTK